MRSDSIGHPTPPESDRPNPRGGGKEERVGPALDKPGLKSRREITIG